MFDSRTSSVFFRGVAARVFWFLAFEFDADFIAQTKTLFPAFHFVASLLSCFLIFAEIEN